MGALPHVLEIIFEVQRKMSNERITRREISFPIYLNVLKPTYLRIYLRPTYLRIGR
jgi:hypothetical protein